VAVTDVIATSAVSGGEFTDYGGSNISVRGAVWSTSHDPTLASNEGGAVSDDDIGDYSVTLSGLAPGTTWYVRAYATNDTGTGYGQEVSFSTPAVLPTVTTAAASAIGATSAIGGGEVTATGGDTVYQRGLLWSTEPDITIANAQHTLLQGSGTGPFTAQMTSLSPNTTWYVRAFASNVVGHSYGQERTFTTAALTLPTVQTLSVQSVTATSAQCAGEALSDGDSPITQRGLVWSTQAEPTLETHAGQAAVGTGTGEFASEVTALAPATMYYVRAYATNAVGTAYGEPCAFTTAAASADPDPATAPTVTTASIADLASTSAQSGGTVSEDGGAVVLARGVVWSTAGDPTLENNVGQTADGQGEGDFTSEITGLLPETTYYVRAYATNSVGTAYGEQLSFITPDPAAASTELPGACALIPLLAIALLCWMFRMVTVPYESAPRERRRK
jgi:hypothetical protein